MKHAIFYIAVAVVAVAAAVYAWRNYFAAKPTGPTYTMGDGRGSGVDFMDTSKAQGGITPIKGNLETVSFKQNFKNPWMGAFVAVKSTMPTANPVQVQTKTIWG